MKRQTFFSVFVSLSVCWCFCASFLDHSLVFLLGCLLLVWTHRINGLWFYCTDKNGCHKIWSTTKAHILEPGFSFSNIFFLSLGIVSVSLLRKITDEQFRGKEIFMFTSCARVFFSAGWIVQYTHDPELIWILPYGWYHHRGADEPSTFTAINERKKLQYSSWNPNNWAFSSARLIN